jgi:hypothetical protein
VHVEALVVVEGIVLVVVDDVVRVVGDVVAVRCRRGEVSFFLLFCGVSSYVCVFITAVPIIKLFAWGEGDSGGHVQRETTSRGPCGLVCPSRTSERGGEGDSVKEGREKKGSARGSVHWGFTMYYYATALDIEVDR